LNAVRWDQDKPSKWPLARGRGKEFTEFTGHTEPAAGVNGAQGEPATNTSFSKGWLDETHPCGLISFSPERVSKIADVIQKSLPERHFGAKPCKAAKLQSCKAAKLQSCKA
jgi:hypothetical protein